MARTAAQEAATHPERLALLRSLTPPLRLRYTPITPTPKQHAFLTLKNEEVFYGGSVGGGKSYAILMAALMYADVPGYAALILRKSFSDLSLPGALMEVAQDWLGGTDAKWVDAKHTWFFPGGGSLTFGYLEGPRDRYRYQSAAFQYLAFDELTHFRESDYTYLFSRCRRPKGVLKGLAPDGLGIHQVPLRIRSASNPGGVGHCVPYGDVLTPNGWVDIQAMRVGHPVYAVTAAGELVPSRVDQVHQTAAPVTEVTTRGLHMAVTDEHRVAKIRGVRPGLWTRSGMPPARFSLVPFNELPGQATILRTVEWHCAELAPVQVEESIWPGKSRARQPSVLTAEQYARLLGWFLSEGTLVDRDRAVTIAQSKPASRVRLRAFLEDECGFTVSWSANSAVIYAREWWKHLSEHAPGKCRSKRVPRAILDAPPNVLAAFLDSAMEGDGHWRGPAGGQYYTTSRQLADDFAEIAVKLGYIVYLSSRQRPNRDGLSYAVSIKRTKSGGTELLTGNHIYDVATTTKRRTRQVQREAQPVYCIGVPEHHAFVIRQKGSVWVSGNSWVNGRFIDEQTRSPGAIFMPAKLTENEHVDHDGYMKMLAELSSVDRRRLLEGDWEASDEGAVFKREWFSRGDDPACGRTIRYWDTAATEVSDSNKDPDYTVGVLMGRRPDGKFVIKDVRRAQLSPGKTDDLILETTQNDGHAVEVWIQREPGSASKILHYHYAKLLPGYTVKEHPVGRTDGDKQTRAKPWAAALENGLVEYLPGHWIHEYISEHAGFPSRIHDDQVDASAGAHYILSRREGGTRRSQSPVGVSRIPRQVDRISR